MSPNHIQSANRPQSMSEEVNGFAAQDEYSASMFDLRETLREMAVRELSFGEFRAALENFGTRYA